MISYTKAARKWYAESVKTVKNVTFTWVDDQHVQAYMFRYGWHPAVHLDAGSVLFQSMYQAVSDVALDSSGRFVNNVTRSRPLILHFNGDKSDFGRFESQLWYNQPKDRYVVKPTDGFWRQEDGVFVPYDQVCAGYDSAYALVRGSTYFTDLIFGYDQVYSLLFEFRQ